MKRLAPLSLVALIAIATIAADGCRPLQRGMGKTYYSKGMELQRKGDDAGAMVEFNKAIESDPEMTLAYGERGLLRQKANDNRGAVADFNHLLATTPSSQWAFMARAYSKSKLKDFDGAMADYTSAIGLNPILADAYGRRGIIKSFYNDDVDGGLDDAEKAIEISPSLPEPYIARAIVRDRKDDFKGAMADLDKVEELMPDSEDVCTGKVRIKRRTGNLQGALHDINEAIAAKPATARFYRERYATELLLQNWEGVVADSSRCYDLTPIFRDYASLYRWVAQARLGKLEVADKQLAEYLQSVSTNPENEWTNTIAKFLLGKITEEDFLKAAATGDAKLRDGQKCEAWYFVGVKKVVTGDKVAAIESFRRCLETKKDMFIEYDCAASELKTLTGSSS